jgi:hypothetical protein
MLAQKQAVAVIAGFGGSNSVARASVVGNTVTHGVVLGAIPLVVLYPWLEPLVTGGEKESSESD